MTNIFIITDKVLGGLPTIYKTNYFKHTRALRADLELHTSQSLGQFTGTSFLLSGGCYFVANRQHQYHSVLLSSCSLGLMAYPLKLTWQDKQLPCHMINKSLRAYSYNTCALLLSYLLPPLLICLPATQFKAVYFYKTQGQLSRRAVVSCEAKKKQQVRAYSGQCDHYSELFTRMHGQSKF